MLNQSGGSADGEQQPPEQSQGDEEWGGEEDFAEPNWQAADAPQVAAPQDEWKPF